MKFLLRRLIRAVLLMAGVSVLCFLFTEMAPGSFFDEMRLNPQISPETIASLRLHYGLDQPLATRYLHWVKGAVHADLGYSIAYNSPVAPLLWERAKNTLLLTTVGMAFTWTLSLPIGIWSASRHDRLLDRVVNAGTSLLISIPEVVIGLTLLAIVVRWRILPVGGIHSLDSDGLSRGALVWTRSGTCCCPRRRWCCWKVPSSYAMFALVLWRPCNIRRSTRRVALEFPACGCSGGMYCPWPRVRSSLFSDFRWRG